MNTGSEYKFICASVSVDCMTSAVCGCSGGHLLLLVHRAERHAGLQRRSSQSRIQSPAGVPGQQGHGLLPPGALLLGQALSSSTGSICCCSIRLQTDITLEMFSSHAIQLPREVVCAKRWQLQSAAIQPPCSSLHAGAAQVEHELQCGMVECESSNHWIGLHRWRCTCLQCFRCLYSLSSCCRSLTRPIVGLGMYISVSISLCCVLDCIWCEAGLGCAVLCCAKLII